MKSPTYAVVLALAASWAGAESLADAANRERARREKAKEAGVEIKVIDADELVRTQTKTDGRGTFSLGTTGDGGGAESSPSPSSSSQRIDTRRPGGARLSDGASLAPPMSSSAEAQWRARARAAQAWVDAARKRRAQAPSIPTAGSEVSTRRPRREVQTSCGVRVRIYENPDEEVREAERAQSEFEEEARRAGALPGWLR
jgi:hypothetical protein